MIDNYIQLGKSDTLKLGIRTEDGKDTGEYLEFDLEDIELPLRYQELIERVKKNNQYIKNQLIIIGKRQDVKGKKLLSKNEEDEIKAINDYYKKQIETYNMFLGENGVQKLLNGRKIGWTTLQEIDELIEKQIAPYIEINKKKITDKIKEKYSQAIKKNEDIEVIK